MIDRQRLSITAKRSGCKTLILTGILLFLSLASLAAKQQKVVDYARSKLDIPYRYNGRLTTKNPELDCMGICFRAFASVYGERWTGYSVIPSKLIKAGDLGIAIDGKAHVFAEDLVAMMQPGDVVYFLVGYKAIADEAVSTDEDGSWWVYHMGIYSGNGKIIHASPWAGKVVEEDLSKYREQFRFLVTRRSKP